MPCIVVWIVLAVVIVVVRYNQKTCTFYSCNFILFTSFLEPKEIRAGILSSRIPASPILHQVNLNTMIEKKQKAFL